MASCNYGFAPAGMQHIDFSGVYVAGSVFVDTELFTFVTKLFRPVACAGTGVLVGLGGNNAGGRDAANSAVLTCCVAGVGHLFATSRIAAVGGTVLSNLPPDG